MIEKDRILPDSREYRELPLEHFLQAIQKEGFQRADIWGGVPHIFTDPYGVGNLDSLKEALRRYQILPVCYHPEAYGYSLCSEKGSMLRAASLDYYCYCAEAAAQIGASVMAVEISNGQRDIDRRKLFELAAEGLERVYKACQSYHIKLIWKNGRVEDGSPSVTLEDAQRLFEILKDRRKDGGKGQGIEVDLNRIHQEKEKLDGWLAAFGKNIQYITGIWENQKAVEQAETYGYCGFYGQGSVGRRSG